MKTTYLDEDEPAPSSALLPLFMPADDPRGLQGFARVSNLSDRAGEVTIRATDDSGQPSGPVSLSLFASQTKHFNSNDLEDSNPTKGLSGGVGDGSGNWRLDVSTDLHIEARAFVRTTDGFVTSMQQLVAETEEGSMRYRVPTFNPGGNAAQRSSLRLINPGESVANVTIDGQDDSGNAQTGDTVHLELAPGEAKMLSAQELEEGGSDFSGRFGAGTGKWQLFVVSDCPIHLMSLLYSRDTGNLTNLSLWAARRVLPRRARDRLRLRFRIRARGRRSSSLRDSGRCHGRRLGRTPPHSWDGQSSREAAWNISVQRRGSLGPVDRRDMHRRTHGGMDELFQYPPPRTSGPGHVGILPGP